MLLTKSISPNHSNLLKNMTHHHLHQAIKNNETLKLHILSRLPIDFNHTYNGLTPLQCALKYYNFEYIEYAARNKIKGMKITSHNLNTLVTEGDDANKSIAYWLAISNPGLGILAANNCELGRQITTENLNTTIKYGEQAGYSTAYVISRSIAGIAILAANKCELGIKISSKTLNCILDNRYEKGLSVAYFLIKAQRGLEILAAKNYLLGRQINLETLNSRYNKQQPLRSVLIESVRGQAILNASNNTRFSQCFLHLSSARILAHNNTDKEPAPVAHLPQELIRMLAQTLGAKPAPN